MADWIPNIYIDHTSKSPSQVIEEMLAVLVRAKLLTVSGPIGERVMERVRELDVAFLTEIGAPHG